MPFFSAISTGQSGYSGAMGPPGYNGLDGASGFSGYSGYSGRSGVSGYSGYSGYSGRSGYSGYSGYSGATGSAGSTGTSGFSGYSGYSGKSGYSGYSGYSGVSGFSGYSGYSGKSGYSGVAGASGVLSSAYVEMIDDGGYSGTQWEYSGSGSWEQISLHIQGVASGITATGGQATVSKPGIFLVTCQLSFGYTGQTGSIGAGDTFSFSIFVNGSQTSIETIQTDDAKYAWNVGLTGLLDLGGGAVVDVRMIDLNGATYTLPLEWGNMCIVKVA